MIEEAVLLFLYLIQGAGSTAFGVGVFFAHGCTVYAKALVVVGITFPVVLLVVKAFSLFIAPLSVPAVSYRRGWFFASIGWFSVVFLFLHAALCPSVCQIQSATSYR